jgi:hypothetical protein
LAEDDNEISFIEQQVTVPANLPFLSYWHLIDSDDLCGFDYGGVLVDGNVEAVYNLCSAANTGGWVRYSVDLSSYAGQTVSIQIRAETDSSVRSGLFIDDVSFQATSLTSGDDSSAFDPRNLWPESERMMTQTTGTAAGAERVFGK